MNLSIDDIHQDIKLSVARALAEDLGSGDITADLLPAHHINLAKVITREACVVCGIPWFNEVFHQVNPTVSLHWQVKEGDWVEPNTCLVELTGQSRSLVTAERTALNYLQLLSGTATQSRRFAKLVEGTNIKILDTRKTLPGLRLAQKYAVTVGGCHNHRIGLYDAYLIKENHIVACGGISQAILLAQSLHPEKPIIVEVENYAEYCEATQFNVQRIMLDNITLDDLEKVSAHPSTIPVEISGNITTEHIQRYKAYKVAAISSGSLTKHVKSIDLSMRLYECPHTIKPGL